LARGLASLRVTAQPWAGHRRSYDYWAVQEWATDRAGTVVFLGDFVIVGRDGMLLVFILIF
jgi:hypothetical protein